MASRAFFISKTSTDPMCEFYHRIRGFPTPMVKSPALPRFLLPLVVFLTGACVLIVEVLAVRVFSPFYGNTIYTVSSVISVILLALSIGYYAGGVSADRRPSRERFFGVILASGIVLLVLYVVVIVIMTAGCGALDFHVGYRV